MRNKNILAVLLVLLLVFSSGLPYVYVDATDVPPTQTLGNWEISLKSESFSDSDSITVTRISASERETILNSLYSNQTKYAYMFTVKYFDSNSTEQSLTQSATLTMLDGIYKDESDTTESDTGISILQITQNESGYSSSTLTPNGAVEFTEDGMFKKCSVNINSTGMFALVSDKDIFDDIPEPGTVDKTSYAPMNNLQILNNMEGASVQILSYSGVVVDSNEAQIKEIDSDHEPLITKKDNGDETEESAKITNAVDASLSQGDFWGYDGSDNDGLHNYMCKSMRGSTGDNQYGGISILFKGSNKDAGNYDTDYDAGWDSGDLSFDTTSMWVKLKYLNVGYYKGKKINAIATLRIIPSKNRNRSASWNDEEWEYNYRGTYHPMLQISHSLYRGWVWQNVKNIKIDIQFYYSSQEPGGKDVPTGFIELAANNNKTEGYNALYADYYVFNSLNPRRDTTEYNERYAHYIGPEFVLPNQKINNAYIVGEYTVDGENYSSNINSDYSYAEDDTEKKNIQTQYAYNGGTNAWASQNDHIGADGFAQNSVLVMPAASSRLSFTMGHMYRDEYVAQNGSEKVSGVKPHTDSMWASISTTPFTIERTPINININKTWDNSSISNVSDNVKSITCILYMDKVSDSEEYEPEEVQRVELTAANSWKSQFSMISQLSEGYKYVVEEVINYKENVTKYGFDFSVNEVEYNDTKDLTDGTSKTDGSITIKKTFELTNTPILGKITIVKTDDNGKVLPEVTFRLDKADSEWNVTETVGVVSETTDSKGEIVFQNLEMGNYLLTEVKTPSGYMLLKDPIKITIPCEGDDGKTLYELTYNITNGQAFSLPQTGACDYGWRISLGMFMIIISGLILTQRNYKRNIRK